MTIDDIRARAEGVGYRVDFVMRVNLPEYDGDEQPDRLLAYDYPRFGKLCDEVTEFTLTIANGERIWFHGLSDELFQAALDLIEAEERRQACPNPKCEGGKVVELVIKIGGEKKAYGHNCPDCEGTSTGKKVDIATKLLTVPKGDPAFALPFQPGSDVELKSGDETKFKGAVEDVP